jgi:hypothetical protein
LYATKNSELRTQNSLALTQTLSRSTTQLIFCFFLILSSLFFALPSNTVHAAQVTLAWDRNAESNVEGYKVYYGTTSRDYDWVIDVGDVTSVTITDLTDGFTFYFAATAYDTATPPLESTYSDEVSKSTCSYSISPTNASFSASGGTGSVSVTTQAGCPWTASSGAAWMTITSGSSGSGNGTVNYSISSNTGSSRTSGSTIAGRVFTVTQAAATTYTITTSAGTGGTISPSGAVSVSHGTNRTFTITASSGYTIANVLVDGSSVGALTSFTFTNINSSHTISASFVEGYTLMVTTTGTGIGEVTTNPSATIYPPGTEVTLRATKNVSSIFEGFSGDCTSNKTSCTITMNKHATVMAAFKIKTLKVRTTAIGNGTVSVEEPASIQDVKKVKNEKKVVKVNRSKHETKIYYGDQLVYNITPEPGSYIKKVLVDGKPYGSVEALTFTDVKRNHNVKVKFELETKTNSHKTLRLTKNHIFLRDDDEQGELQTLNDLPADDGDDHMETSSTSHYASATR